MGWRAVELGPCPGWGPAQPPPSPPAPAREVGRRLHYSLPAQYCRCSAEIARGGGGASRGWMGQCGGLWSVEYQLHAAEHRPRPWDLFSPPVPAPARPCIRTSNKTEGFRRRASTARLGGQGGRNTRRQGCRRRCSDPVTLLLRRSHSPARPKTPCFRPQPARLSLGQNTRPHRTRAPSPFRRAAGPGGHSDGGAGGSVRSTRPSSIPPSGPRHYGAPREGPGGAERGDPGSQRKRAGIRLADGTCHQPLGITSPSWGAGGLIQAWGRDPRREDSVEGLEPPPTYPLPRSAEDPAAAAPFRRPDGVSCWFVPRVAMGW